ncbi:FAD binding domain-containing protein [Diaporthe sp. PMI_573]|nr:FAD binding domain-containing protein [Diaporthaceae sp. PMI_573]
MSSPLVLIVGAGPVGLTTALCLQQGGVPARDILIVDQRPARETSNRWSKALSMSASSLEIFRTLGITDRFIEVGTPLHANHFGGGPQLLSLNYDVIGTKYSFNLHLPQLRTEDILLKRCEEVGIQFTWGLRFSALSQTGTGVLATFHDLKSDGPSVGAVEELETIEATWLIGCDGTQSAVRKAAGIIFDGTKASHYSWLADGHCDPDAPRARTGQDRQGTAILAVLGDSPTARRFISHVPPLTTDERPTALNESQVRESIEKAFGSHYNFHNLTWSSVVGNGMRLAKTFRSGRIFIAGDAAHQLFPAGGQGMNTGLLDATNLGWKLAAVITGKVRADTIERVLDSYTTERRTSVQAVISNIRVQMQVAFEETEDEKAVSRFVVEALGQPSLNKAWARRVTGFGDPVEPYQLALMGEGTSGSDNIVGTRLTHIAEEGGNTLLKARDQGVFILAAMSSLKATNAGDFEAIVKASGHGDQVHVLETPLVASGDKWNSVAALLIRPDLRVAWAASSDADIEVNEAKLAKVLQWWLG